MLPLQLSFPFSFLMRYDSGSPANASDDASSHEVGGTRELTEDEQLGMFFFFASLRFLPGNTPFQPS
jgi:hypothetical protein